MLVVLFAAHIGQKKIDRHARSRNIKQHILRIQHQEQVERVEDCDALLARCRANESLAPRHALARIHLRCGSANRFVASACDALEHCCDVNCRKEVIVILLDRFAPIDRDLSYAHRNVANVRKVTNAHELDARVIDFARHRNVATYIRGKCKCSRDHRTEGMRAVFASVHSRRVREFHLDVYCDDNRLVQKTRDINPVVHHSSIAFADALHDGCCE